MTDDATQAAGELFPPPLVPANCDLRSYKFMPLYIERLRKSKAWAMARRRPELGYFMLNLWTGSWHLIPAGSLPNDEVELADIAMASTDQQWRKVRDGAMHGWTLCSDGRWYHPTVAEMVLEALEFRSNQVARTEKARATRAAKQNTSVTEAVTKSVTVSVTENATEDVTRQRQHSGSTATSSTATATATEERRTLAPAIGVSDPQAGGEGLELCKLFLATKQRLWPEDPSTPPSLQAQRGYADAYLAMAPPEIVRAELVVVLEAAHRRGGSAVRSFGGIDRSLKDRLVAKPKPNGANGHGQHAPAAAKREHHADADRIFRTAFDDQALRARWALLPQDQQMLATYQHLVECMSDWLYAHPRIDEPTARDEARSMLRAQLKLPDAAEGAPTP